MKKMQSILKKYGFYIAVGLVCVGAVAAVFVLPGKQGNVAEEPNPYADNEQVDGRVLDEIVPDQEDVLLDSDVDGDGVIDTDLPADSIEQDEIVVAEEEQGATSDDDVVAQTFDPTTAPITSEPFFAEGDKVGLPVNGQVIVPYSDAGTKYWYSEALNQTMRTFGICVSAAEGETVRAVADGTIVNIIDDASEMDGDMTCFGKAIVLDAGNGYVFRYGIQGGNVDKSLLGKTVKAGDAIGTAGKGQGAYASLGTNVYLQLIRNNEVANVLNVIDASMQVAEQSVDVGIR